MKVMFKGVEGAFECTEPIEQKLFQGGSAVGWVLMFHIHGGVSSSDVDGIITPESISDMTFISGEDDNQTAIRLTGYSEIRACTIRHRAGSAVTELQFTKANAPAAKEGAVENG